MTGGGVWRGRAAATRVDRTVEGRGWEEVWIPGKEGVGVGEEAADEEAAAAAASEAIAEATEMDQTDTMTERE